MKPLRQRTRRSAGVMSALAFFLKEGNPLYCNRYSFPRDRQRKPVSCISSLNKLLLFCTAAAGFWMACGSYALVLVAVEALSNRTTCLKPQSAQAPGIFTYWARQRG